MKALKILSLVLFSSMIMWACEDTAVDPKTDSDVILERHDENSGNVLY